MAKASILLKLDLETKAKFTDYAKSQHRTVSAQLRYEINKLMELMSQNTKS